MNVIEINEMSREDAIQYFGFCCASDSWIYKMLAARPFKSMENMKEIGDRFWSESKEEDLLQAFMGHPKIGGHKIRSVRFENTADAASKEQSSAMKADDQTKLDLREANEKYFKKFGFIFIVFATGKSGSEILKLLTDRLENTRAQELRNAGEEQRRIMQLRLMNGP